MSGLSGRLTAVLLAALMVSSMLAGGVAAGVFGEVGDRSDDPTAGVETDGTVEEVVVRFAEPDSVGANGEVTTDDLRSHAADSQADFETFAAETPAVSVRNQFWIANAIVVEVDTDRVPVDRLERVDGVEYTHENFAVELDSAAGSSVSTGSAGSAPGATTVGSTSSDIDATYGVDMVRAPEVWETFDTRGEGTTVAVIDTGVDATHPDLDGKVTGWAEYDTDGTLVEEGVENASDENGHGTHVAGTVAGGNGSGQYVGVAPDADLHGIKVFPDGERSTTLAAILGGMEHAIDDGEVDVLQMSLGTNSFEDAFIEPIRNANAVGKIVVASSGNDGHGNTGSPANAYDAFAVGAVNESRDVADFSGGGVVNTSDEWGNDAPDDWPDEYVVPDVSAPGESVLSTYPDDQYAFSSGTSMAAPHASGAAALVLAATDGELTQDELYAALRDTTDHPDGGGPDDPDDRYGTGIVDAYEAVWATSGPGAAVERDAPGYAEPGSTYEVELAVENAETYTPTLGDESRFLEENEVTLRVLELGENGEVVGLGETVDLGGFDGEKLTVEVETADEAVAAVQFDHEVGGRGTSAASTTTATTKVHPDPFVFPRDASEEFGDSVADATGFVAPDRTIHLEAGTYDESADGEEAAVTVAENRTLATDPDANEPPILTVTDGGAAVALGDEATLDGVDLQSGGLLVGGANATAANVTTDAETAVTVDDGAMDATVEANLTSPNGVVEFRAVDPDDNEVTVELADGRHVEASGRNATLEAGTSSGTTAPDHPLEPLGAYLELNALGGADDASLSFSVSYAEAEVDGLRENTASLYRYDTNDDSWDAVDGAALDAESRTVSATVESFSTFGLLAETERPEFAVTDFDAPVEVVAGETVTVDATVENVGEEAGDTRVAYDFADEGEVDESTTGELAAGDDETVTLSYAVPEEADRGSYTHTVRTPDDEASATIDVLRPATFEVSALDAPESIGQSETLNASATVTNVGDVSGENSVELRIGDDIDGDAGDGEEGTYVVLDDGSVSLDANGDAVVDLSGQVPSDFTTGETTVAVVSPDDDARADIAVSEATGTLVGNVTNAETETAITGASVTVERDGSVVAETTTNAEGAYEIRAPTGDLTVTASAEHAESATGNVTLSSGETNRLDLALAPLPYFVVTDLEGPGELEQGETGEFDATVRNDGRTDGETTVTFSVDDAEVEAEVVALDVDAEETVTFSYLVPEDATVGEQTAAATTDDDQRELSFEVLEREADEEDDDDGGSDGGGGGSGGGGGGSGGGGGGAGGGGAPAPDPTPTPEVVTEETPTPTPTETPEATPTETPEEGAEETETPEVESPTPAPTETPEETTETPVEETPAGGTDDDSPGFGALASLLAVAAAALLAGRRARREGT